MAEAKKETGANATVIYVPPPFAGKRELTARIALYAARKQLTSCGLGEEHLWGPTYSCPAACPRSRPQPKQSWRPLRQSLIWSSASLRGSRSTTWHAAAPLPPSTNCSSSCRPRPALAPHAPNRPAPLLVLFNRAPSRPCAAGPREASDDAAVKDTTHRPELPRHHQGTLPPLARSFRLHCPASAIPPDSSLSPRCLRSRESARSALCLGISTSPAASASCRALGRSPTRRCVRCSPLPLFDLALCRLADRASRLTDRRGLCATNASPLMLAGFPNDNGGPRPVDVRRHRRRPL